MTPEILQNRASYGGRKGRRAVQRLDAIRVANAKKMRALDFADPRSRQFWPPGPWDAETDDKRVWKHAGFPCMMIRNNFGAWCGYVGVPAGHPFHGFNRQHPDLKDLNVHGGITFAEPAPGEPDDVWWFGFDTNHLYDLAPGNLALEGFLRSENPGLPKRPAGFGEYRTADYVTECVNHLADQLAP